MSSSEGSGKPSQESNNQVCLVGLLRAAEATTAAEPPFHTPHSTKLPNLASRSSPEARSYRTDNLLEFIKENGLAVQMVPNFRVGPAEASLRTISPTPRLRRTILHARARIVISPYSPPCVPDVLLAKASRRLWHCSPPGGRSNWPRSSRPFPHLCVQGPYTQPYTHLASCPTRQFDSCRAAQGVFRGPHVLARQG